MPQAPTPPVLMEYAGFWIRFVAELVDLLIIVTPLFFVTILTGIIGTIGEDLFFYCVIVPAGLIYQVGMLTKFSATLGKMTVGIKVISGASQKLSIGQILLREIVGKGFLSNIMYLGYIWVAFDEKKQGWHDKIAGTYVVKIR
jgi:uncharacterized RDD family membrane protein YckC